MSNPLDQSQVDQDQDEIGTESDDTEVHLAAAQAENEHEHSSEQIDRDWKIYEEHRKELLKAQFDSVKTFETWLLGLSGGALTLSISFVKELVGADKTQSSGLLFSSWVLFGGAACFVLLIKLTSYIAHKKCIKQLDDVFKQYSKEYCGEEGNQKSKKNGDTVWDRYDQIYRSVYSIKLIYIFRALALSCFFSGIITLSFFVLVNVGPKPMTPSSGTSITIVGGTVTVTGLPTTASAPSLSSEPQPAAKSQTPMIPKQNTTNPAAITPSQPQPH